MRGPGGIDRLDRDAAREALRLLGRREPPGQRSEALRELRETFRAPGGVQTILDGAPPAARDAFLRLAHDGPAAVEDLLDRGWWGHGMLPAPLDWLQRRALVVVGDDGLVHATADARDGLRALTLDLAEPARPGALRVQAARAVVVADDPQALDRALPAPGADLRAIAPTVAVSARSPAAVASALRAAGLRLDEDLAVEAAPDAPALPGTPEEAVGPRALRALFARAVEERRQVRLVYYASSRGGAATERTVDPWTFHDDLLRGYCHLRDGERAFAVDRVGRATLLPTTLEQAPPA